MDAHSLLHASHANSNPYCYDTTSSGAKHSTRTHFTCLIFGNEFHKAGDYYLICAQIRARVVLLAPDKRCRFTVLTQLATRYVLHTEWIQVEAITFIRLWRCCIPLGLMSNNKNKRLDHRVVFPFRKYNKKSSDAQTNQKKRQRKGISKPADNKKNEHFFAHHVRLLHELGVLFYLRKCQSAAKSVSGVGRSRVLQVHKA